MKTKLERVSLFIKTMCKIYKVEYNILILSYCKNIIENKNKLDVKQRIEISNIVKEFYREKYHG